MKLLELAEDRSSPKKTRLAGMSNLFDADGEVLEAGASNSDDGDLRKEISSSRRAYVRETLIFFQDELSPELEQKSGDKRKLRFFLQERSKSISK